jgi:hypothetical protein
MPVTLPLVILGGSDRRAAALPEAAAGKHPLTGYKGVDVRLGGRPLVEVVAERFLASGAFEPVYVAGPEAVYRACAAGHAHPHRRQLRAEHQGGDGAHARDPPGPAPASPPATSCPTPRT